MKKRLFSLRRLHIIILILVVVGLYLPFANNGFISDDIPAILANPNIGNFLLVKSSGYQFLQPFLYFLIAHFLGIRSIFFHLPNILFHLGNVVLVYLLCSLFLDEFGAFITALFFAVHPVLVESVMWISAISYPAYSFFSLLSLLFIICFFKQHKTRYYIFSLASFLLALLISEKAIVLPLILSLYFFLFVWARNKNTFIYVTPFFVISGIFVFLLLGSIGPRVESFISSYQGGSSYDPFFQIPVAITTYLRLIFLPYGFSLYHTRVISDTEYVFRIILTFLCGIGIALSYKLNKKVFFWLLFFIIALFPTLTSLKISTLFAERYLYLGSLGIFFLVGVAAKNFGKVKMIRYVLYIIVGILFLISFIRNGDWKSPQTFALAEIRVSPDGFQPHYDLGKIYEQNKQYPQAIDEFETAARIIPGYAKVYEELGNVYYKQGNIDLAVLNYKHALRLDSSLVGTYQNLAGIYYFQGNFEEALVYAKQALDRNPHNVELINNLKLIEHKIHQ